MVTDELASFTLSGVRNFFLTLQARGVSFVRFQDTYPEVPGVIVRHDIDLSLTHALAMAEIEADLGVSATYFPLLRTDFYNVFSRRSVEIILKMRSLGHGIGLHFDETAHAGVGVLQLSDIIVQEAEILAEATEGPIESVSMHRPSRELLSANLEIPGLINTYSTLFFNEIKYISDSRMEWRESPEVFLAESEYSRVLQLLIHPIWYSGRETRGGMESNLHDRLETFLGSSRSERYEYLASNIRDLSNIIDH
jgi:hypothetical protein